MSEDVENHETLYETDSDEECSEWSILKRKQMRKFVPVNNITTDPMQRPIDREVIECLNEENKSTMRMYASRRGIVFQQHPNQEFFCTIRRFAKFEEVLQSFKEKSSHYWENLYFYYPYYTIARMRILMRRRDSRKQKQD